MGLEEDEEAEEKHTSAKDRASNTSHASRR